VNIVKKMMTGLLGVALVASLFLGIDTEVHAESLRVDRADGLDENEDIFVGNFELVSVTYDEDAKEWYINVSYEYSNLFAGKWWFESGIELADMQDNVIYKNYESDIESGSGILTFVYEEEDFPILVFDDISVSGESEESNKMYEAYVIDIGITVDLADYVLVDSSNSNCSSENSDKDDKDNYRKKDKKDEKDKEEKIVVQTPENNYGVFQESVQKSIDVAMAKTLGNNTSTAPVTIDTGIWISFKGDVYQKLQDSGLPVQITFQYQGIRYRVDIPANADLMSLVDENGYCGFLNLMAHFGGTVL